MPCNNVIPFEAIIPIPDGFEYVASDGETTRFYISVDTDNLVKSTELIDLDIQNTNIACNQNILASVNLYEMRVSGYLNYSLSIKCLKSDPNFIVNNLYTIKDGCVSTSGKLVVSSLEDDINYPYMVINYSASSDEDFDVKVVLTELSVEEVLVDNNIIVAKGKFEIVNQ